MEFLILVLVVGIVAFALWMRRDRASVDTPSRVDDTSLDRRRAVAQVHGGYGSPEEYVAEGNRKANQGDVAGAVAAYSKGIDVLQTHYRYLEQGERKPSPRDLEVIRPFTELIWSLVTSLRHYEFADEIGTAASRLDDIVMAVRDSGLDEVANEMEETFWQWRSVAHAQDERPAAQDGEPWYETARRVAEHEKRQHPSPRGLLLRAETLLEDGDSEPSFFTAFEAWGFFQYYVGGSTWLHFYPGGLSVLSSSLAELRREHGPDIDEEGAAILHDMMREPWADALERYREIESSLAGQDREAFLVAMVAAGTHVTQMKADDLRGTNDPPKWAREELAESVHMLDKAFAAAQAAGVAIPGEMRRWHGVLPEMSDLWT